MKIWNKSKFMEMTFLCFRTSRIFPVLVDEAANLSAEWLFYVLYVYTVAYMYTVLSQFLYYVLGCMESSYFYFDNIMAEEAFEVF